MSARDRFLAYRRAMPRPPALHRQRVRVRGGALAVWSTPPVDGATPLVCVHGGMIHDHTLLWPALAPLAAARQLILYDQRGRGESDAPANVGEHRIDDDAADLGALRRALGLRQWDVLGHSWGGGIALLGTAADHVGVRRLVLVGAVGATSAWMPALRATARTRIDPPDRATLDALDDVALGDPDPAVHDRHARATYRAWFSDPALGAIFSAPTGTSATGAAVLARLRREGYDWRDRVRAVRTPSLVIHGADDALPPSVAADHAALLSNARLELISGSGHLPFWEAPDRFFPLVEAFLPHGASPM